MFDYRRVSLKFNGLNESKHVQTIPAAHRACDDCDENFDDGGDIWHGHGRPMGTTTYQGPPEELPWVFLGFSIDI